MKDWSATRQAEENLVSRQMSNAEQASIDTLKDDIKRIDIILSDLNDLKSGVDDVVSVVNILGALQARLKRSLHIAQQ